MKTIIEQAAKMLFDLGSEYDNISNKSSRLIFPTQEQPKKGKRKRVSEQELRQCFIEAIKNTDYHYSIETPTEIKFRIKGGQDISGNLDLCLHSEVDNSLKREICIEFKAHNMSSSYLNDLLKTTREHGNNLYYHLLESSDNGTLTSTSIRGKGLLVKLEEDLQTIDVNEINSESLTIAIACLSPRLLIYQRFSKDSLQKRNYNIMDFKYHIERKKLDILDAMSWSVLIK